MPHTVLMSLEQLVPQNQNIIGYVPKANKMVSKNFKYNLISYWSFDDCSLQDFLNNNYECVDGVRGKAAHIKPTKFLRPPFIDFNKYNEFTLSLWVKLNKISNNIGDGYIFFGDRAKGWVGIANLWGKIHFNVGANARPRGAGILKHDAKNYNNEFHHFILSYKNGLMETFIDGKYYGRSNQKLVLPNQNKRAAISGRYWNNGRSSSHQLDIVYDEIIILNKKVTREEAKMLYKGEY